MPQVNQAEFAKLEGPFCVWEAHHCPNTKQAKSATADDCGLECVTAVAPLAKVILSSNLWISRGLVNGSLGHVVAILYEQHPSRTTIPSVILVHFPGYVGEACLPPPYHPKVLPVLPSTYSYMKGGCAIVKC